MNERIYEVETTPHVDVPMSDRWNCTLCHAPSMPAETNAKAK